MLEKLSKQAERTPDLPQKPTNSRAEGMMMLVPYLPKTTELERRILHGMKETKENEGIFSNNILLTSP